MIYCIGKLFHQSQKLLLLLLPLCFDIPCLGNYKNHCSGRDSRFGISVTDICKFPELGREMSVGFQFDRFRFPSFGILLWNRTGVSALMCGYESREVCCVTISLSCQIMSCHIRAILEVAYGDTNTKNILPVHLDTLVQVNIQQ